MEKKNSNSSKPFTCKKLRAAVATSPALRVFRHGWFSHHTAAAQTDLIHDNPRPHQHVKVSDHFKEPDGLIPVKFDYSNPTSNGNGGKLPVPATTHGAVAASLPNANGYNNTSQKTGRAAIRKGDGQLVKVPSKVKPEPPNVKAQPHQVKASTRQNNGLHGSSAYKKQGSDVNDTFSDYIRRARMAIRTFSNTGDGRNYAASSTDADADHEGTKKMENTKDHFSDFICRARMRIRTSSNLGRGNVGNSFKIE